MPKRSWLVRTTAVDGFPPLDPKTIAMLRKDYADMFETGEAQWKVNFDKHIAKARELESKATESKDAKEAKEAKDIKDTDDYFRSSFDSFDTEHND